jgi:hypothetical protein
MMDYLLKELVVFGPDGKPDPKYPRMPNALFRIDAPPVSRAPTQIVPNPTHLYYQNQEQLTSSPTLTFGQHLRGKEGDSYGATHEIPRA